MSTAVLSETIISFGQAAGMMPWPVSRISVCRWARRGCRGVRLEAARVGGKIVTSKEAVARFLSRLNGEPIQAEPAPAASA